MSGDVPAWHEGQQAILNSHDVPGRFTRARIPIPVTARILWEADGEEQLETVATAWTRTLVLVDVNDRRFHIRAAWVAVADVRRR